MFKGLHSALQKAKPAVVSQAKHPDATQIQTAEVLLAPEKRQKHLRNIKSLLNLPPKLYDSLYYRVIEHFVEFTQNLPETQYGLFANEGGFIDHALERASRALNLCLQYFFPQEKSLQNISAQEALWIYAVFTAALLYDLPKIAVKYKVEICNRDGSIVKEWLPYSGPMGKGGKYYRFSYVKENRDNLKRLIAGLLARQILDANPEEAHGGTGGFNWIASNPDVLETWLMILQGEKRMPMSSYLSVVPLADSQIIEAFFAGRIETPGMTPGILPFNSMFDNSPPLAEGQDYKTTTGVGQDFIKWVRDNVANHNLSVNQMTPNSDLHIVEEGVLVNPELFDKYVTETVHENLDATSVKKHFLQTLESTWDSPGNLQHRYQNIQGLASTNVQKYLLVSAAHLLVPAESQHEVNPRLAQAPLQVAKTPPGAIPTPVEQRQNNPQLNF